MPPTGRAIALASLEQIPRVAAIVSGAIGWLPAVGRASDGGLLFCLNGRRLIPQRRRNLSHPAMQSPNLQTLSAVLKVAILSAVLSITIKLAATGSIDAPPNWVAWLLILLPSAILAVWMWQQGPVDRPSR